MYSPPLRPRVKTMAASRFQVYFKSALLLFGSVALNAGAHVSKSTAESAQENLGRGPSLTAPCRDTPSLVSPEYPQPAYSTSQIARMFKRPKGVSLRVALGGGVGCLLG
jgi:hypothetical protein